MARMVRFLCFLVVSSFFLAQNALGQQADDQVPIDFLSSAHPHSLAKVPRGHLNGQSHARFGLAGIDSIANWNKHFDAEGIGVAFDSKGNPFPISQHVWYYSMVGNPPELGGATEINAPIVPVSLDLRNADGTPRFVNGKRLIYDVTPFVAPTVNSPVFQNFKYSSGDTATQFTDAVQRAEFFDRMKPDWHTLLKPSVKATRTMVLVQGTYRFALNGDGSCCRFVLVDADTFINELFPPAFPFDNSTAVGSAENAGDMTTKDISTFLFPNTYLYTEHDPTHCCILGFHSFDFEPGVPANGNLQRWYIMNYSSWITPGLFRGGLGDVTALSHEMSEIFNDPFVVADGIHNATPFWSSPNGNCQNNLEVGDVIEGLPNQIFPITMNGMTYHPQNEALLQWFEFESPSSALGGAYSYPNTGTLQALSPPQNFGCQ
jgi:hypothetical protein